jgi:membrane-associated phospholipid phosphatase
VNRRHDPTSKALQFVGNGLPYAEFGLAGATWLSQRGTPLGDTAFASVEAGLGALALSEVAKQAFDRSRPSVGAGAADFGHGRRSDGSFPSNHAALAWGVVTPFAQQYDAPWLYGVAALTNLSRVLGRDHWFSDTVAGAALGYVVGDWFHQRAGLGPAATQAQLLVAPHSIGMTMNFQ